MGKSGILGMARASDGRIRASTGIGAMLLAGILAIFGVFPALAGSGQPSAAGVQPSEIGFSPLRCDIKWVAGLPSAATHHLHIPSPTSGTSTWTGPDGTKVTINVYDYKHKVDFEFVDPSMAAFDVLVKGGTKQTHYDYDNGSTGPLSADQELHAPTKGGSSSTYQIGHIDICYDEQPVVTFVCGVPQPLEGTGVLTDVEATIFDNSVEDCTEKDATYNLDDDVVTLAFEGDGGDIVAGRIDFTKDFGDPALFEDLEYRRTVDDPYGDVAWCDVRAKIAGDGDDFNDVLDADEYPSLVGVTDDGGPAISCKVFEGEDAAGIQHTAVYFELEDPQWK